MALIDVATLNPSTGHFYTATTATAAPTNLITPGAGWTEIGHTSLDSVFALASSGGDQTVLGTLQAKSLRTSTSARTETFSFNIAQWDSASLALYYGSNSTLQSTGPGTGFQNVPDAPTATQKAFLAVFIDGANQFAFYAPKAELTRGDDINIADTTSLALLPIKVTPLNYNGADSKYYVKAMPSA